MPTAYSYIRFSSREQSKGGSLARQTRLAREYLVSHPELVLDESLRLEDLAVSAFKKANLAKGAALRAFLDAVDSSKVLPGSYLLVESLDRITRANIMDAFQLFMDILKRDIIIVTLIDGNVYSEERAKREPMVLMMSLLILTRAGEESATKSDRLQKAWAQKRAKIDQQKLTKNGPSWLTLSTDGKSYSFIPEKVALVKEAVKLLLAGVGKDAIAKRFNEQGIPSIGTKSTSKIWYGSYITKILRNRALIGEFQLHKEVDGKRIPFGSRIQNYFPRVLSDERFAVVQHVIDERGKKTGGRRGKNFPNLFTGLVRCGYCGSTMGYQNKGLSKRTGRLPPSNRFLVCHRAKVGAGCYYIPWTYTEIEDGILRHARGINFKGFMKAATDREGDAQEYANAIVVKRAKLSDVTARRDRLIDALELAQDTAPSVISRIKQLETDIAETTESLKQLELKHKAEESYDKSAAESVNAIRSLIKLLATATGDDLYLLRSRLNEHLRHALVQIQIFAGGTIHTKAEVDAMRQELLKSKRYTPEQIDKDLPVIMAITPDKTARYLVLRRRAGGVQILRPHEEFPDRFAVMSEAPKLYRHWLDRQKNKPSKSK